MKKEINQKEVIYPMPVICIATYNEDDSVNIMTAAWATMQSRDHVALNLGRNSKTVQNIRNKKAFTVSIVDANHIVEADYLGIVSGNKVKDKLETSGFTVTKSTKVNAPIINELPIAIKCEFVEEKENEYGVGVFIIGKVMNTLVEERLLADGKVDMSKAEAAAIDPYTHTYFKVTEKIGKAFNIGLKLKR